MSSLSQQHHRLERLEAEDTRETLGVYVAMSGDQEKQRKELQNKALKFASKMQTGSYSPNEAIWTYKHCFQPQIFYCTSVTDFNNDQWTNIVAPAKQATLHKAQMSSGFPKAVLYGPTSLQGFGWTDPYTKQTMDKIAMLLQEAPDETQTRKLLQGVSEKFCIELGMNFTLGLIK